MKEEKIKEKKVIKNDGTIAYIFEGKIHSWEGPALIFPKEMKKKDEYYIYGIQYTKEQWEDFRKNREGLPYYKQSSFKGERV